MELIRKGLKSTNKEVLGEEVLQRWAVGGELFCDTAYYSSAGIVNIKVYGSGGY